jgi:hypothetical protein
MAFSGSLGLPGRKFVIDILIGQTNSGRPASGRFKQGCQKVVART